MNPNPETIMTANHPDPMLPQLFEVQRVKRETADTYTLDWRLLPSISYLESTGGKAGRNNNIFGWDSGRARFSTPAAGIYAVGYRLAYSGLYRDKSLDEVLTTYNPDAAYGRKVKSVMRRIAAIQ